jgi:D-alanine-D-alanine ligase
MTHVAVLKGGRSLEREISLRSGQRAEEALRGLGFRVTEIDVGHDLVSRLRELRPDACFVALHGRDGEDGTVQELLEILGIPYTGSGVSACIRCTDKVLAKHHFVDAGIPTPPFFSFTETAFKQLGAADALDEIAERLGFPIVVKPADQGSSLGLQVAKSRDELPRALVAAFSYSSKVLLECHVAGRDLAVSVLEGEPLPIVEAVPRGGVYDFDARYEFGETDFICPANLDPDVAEQAQELAVDVYELLGCRDVARVDLLCDADGGLHVLEANVIPGLTETSLLPLAADQAGITFDALIERMINAALARGGRAGAQG